MSEPNQDEAGSAQKETPGSDTPQGRSAAPAPAVPGDQHAGFEGDYRPSSVLGAAPRRIETDPIQIEFLMRLANALNTTLDLQTLMHRTAELVRVVIDYKIFAILLLNDRHQ